MALGKGAKAVAAKSSPGAGGQQDGTEEFIIPMGGQIQLVRPSRPVPHLRTHAPGRYLYQGDEQLETIQASFCVGSRVRA
jgi:hypothetical protein